MTSNMHSIGLEEETYLGALHVVMRWYTPKVEFELGLTTTSLPKKPKQPAKENYGSFNHCAKVGYYILLYVSPIRYAAYFLISFISR